MGWKYSFDKLQEPLLFIIILETYLMSACPLVKSFIL